MWSHLLNHEVVEPAAEAAVAGAADEEDGLHRADLGEGHVHILDAEALVHAVEDLQRGFRIVYASPETANQKFTVPACNVRAPAALHPVDLATPTPLGHQLVPEAPHRGDPAITFYHQHAALRLRWQWIPSREGARRARFRGVP